MDAVIDAIHIFLIESIVISVLFVLLGMLLSHRYRKRTKVITFECGQNPFEWRSYRFPIQYFPYLLVYVVYAAVAVLVFISIVYAIGSDEAMPKLLMLFALLTIASIFLSINLRNLSQKI